MAYYMLFTSEDKGPWAPQFGDKDRECVLAEKDEYLDADWDGVAHKRTKIVKFPRVPSNAQIEAKRKELTASG